MLKTIAYTRVSGEDNGPSLEAQREVIGLYFKKNNIVSPELFQEQASARTVDRPLFQEILNFVIDKQVKQLIVVRLDRLTRSIRDLVDLFNLFDKYDVEFISINEKINTNRSAAMKFMIDILESVAKWEPRTISERTMQALNIKKERHFRMGNIPYGWKLGKDRNSLLAIPAEQKVLQTIKRLRLKKKLSLIRIAEYLNQNKVKTQKGGLWYHSTIAQMLKRIVA